MAHDIPEQRDLLLAGVIGAARGLRGEVSIDVRTDRPDDVFQKGAVLDTGDSSTPRLRVTSARSHNGRLLLQFSDVTTREAAEALRGVELLVEGTDEDDAWYARDLIGTPVVHVDGREMGVVTGIVPAPAQDLLVVRSGDHDVLVPLVEEIVPTVSLEDRVVVVDPPSGLFPADEDE